MTDQLEQRLSIERLSAAADVLSALQDAFGSLVQIGEKDGADAAQAACYSAIAASYVSELAHYLRNGSGFFDAVRKTQRGELRLTVEQEATFWKAIQSKAHQH